MGDLRTTQSRGTRSLLTQRRWWSADHTARPDPRRTLIGPPAGRGDGERRPAARPAGGSGRDVTSRFVGRDASPGGPAARRAPRRARRSPRRSSPERNNDATFIGAGRQVVRPAAVCPVPMSVSCRAGPASVRWLTDGQCRPVTDPELVREI